MGILDNEDEYYMQQALREARMAAEEDEVPIGAVVVTGGVLADECGALVREFFRRKR